MTVIALVAGGTLLAALVSDAVVGATVAGIFTLVNTALNVVLLRSNRRIQKAMTSPRRLVYDQDGRPIGTVLDLRADHGWDDWLVQGGRRHDDEVSP